MIRRGIGRVEDGSGRQPWGATAVAAALVVAVACTSSELPAADTVSPSPPAGVSEADVASVIDAVSLLVLEDTRLMNQVAVSASVNDQVRTESVDLIQQIIESLEGQLEVVEMLDPVPANTAEAQRLTKLAMAGYIDAAQLLLPSEDAGPDEFDFVAYQALMNDAGDTFHSAGFALPEPSPQGP